MTPLENKCLHTAERLHKDVVYGGGLVMLDQVTRTASLVAQYTQLTGVRREHVICAALLHKCFEEKRIVKGETPLSMDDVAALAGPDIARIVEELSTEPEDKNKTKKEQWQEKADWAKGLSLEAQEILLVEKIINFEVSRDKPNPAKPLSWHKEYYETRMLLVEALKDVNPFLYQMALDIKREGESKIAQMMAQNNGLPSLGKKGR